jgi:UTP--glucose-1-phosphate uridylyltransferase
MAYELETELAVRNKTRLLGEEKVLAYEFEGRRYDCGSKLGYLEATVDYGVRHAEVGEAFTRYLNRR